MSLIATIESDRAKARIPKAELCRRAGVHVETFRRARLSRNSPRLATVEALQRALAALLSEARS